MTSLHVDWAIVSCIAQAVEFTPVNKVTLFVHKYDADDAPQANRVGVSWM